MTIGRFAHAESPVSSVINASPSTTDFSCVFIAILPLSVNAWLFLRECFVFRAMRFYRRCECTRGASPPNLPRIDTLGLAGPLRGPRRVTTRRERLTRDVSAVEGRSYMR